MELIKVRSLKPHEEKNPFDTEKEPRALEPGSRFPGRQSTAKMLKNAAILHRTAQSGKKNDFAARGRSNW
jgi:hypothetical protein